MRLASVLDAEAEEHDAAGAVLDLADGRAVSQVFLAEDPSAQEDDVVGIAGDGCGRLGCELGFDFFVAETAGGRIVLGVIGFGGRLLGSLQCGFAELESGSVRGQLDLAKSSSASFPADYGYERPTSQRLLE